MFLSITRMVVPVLLMFLLGWFCHYRRIISAEGLKGIKDYHELAEFARERFEK